MWILSRQQKSIFSSLYNFKSNPYGIYNSQQSIEIYQGHQEKKRRKAKNFFWPKAPALSDQSDHRYNPVWRNVVSCGPQQLRRALFISLTRTYKTIYTPTHDVYHKNNICHAQMAMKHHIYMIHHHHHDKNSPWLINGSTDFLSQAVGIDRGIGFSFPFSVFEIRGVFLKVSAKGTVFSSLVPFFFFLLQYFIFY